MSDGRRWLEAKLGEGRTIRLATPADEESLLAQAAERAARGEPDEGAPYYAVLWKSAAPLARFVLDRGLARSRRVLELGCGLGLTGIALARFADAEVVLTDAQPGAVDLVRASIEANGPFWTAPSSALLEWNRPHEARLGDAFPLILAADCLYDRAAFAPLARCGRKWLAPGGFFLVAEPGRTVAREAEPVFATEGLVVTERVTFEGVAITILQADGGPAPGAGGRASQ